MNPITYLRHVREEMRHVVWPDARTAAAHTIILILIAAFVAAFIGALDYVFTHLVSQLISH